MGDRMLFEIRRMLIEIHLAFVNGVPGDDATSLLECILTALHGLPFEQSVEFAFCDTRCVRVRDKCVLTPTRYGVVFAQNREDLQVVAERIKPFLRIDGVLLDLSVECTKPCS